mmetsp:Transcript_108849/g.188342  ORF Transcript_108849/g.188342 Transcript_108849/m.188342 type:complete len:105 (-) Transcript_108849:138-452(-)
MATMACYAVSADTSCQPSTSPQPAPYQDFQLQPIQISLHDLVEDILQNFHVHTHKLPWSVRVPQPAQLASSQYVSQAIHHVEPGLIQQVHGLVSMHWSPQPPTC